MQSQPHPTIMGEKHDKSARAKNKKRCVSATQHGVRYNADGSARKKFSNRTMMNELMSVLMGKHDLQSRENDNFPMNFSSISFKYRRLGVNAKANNYAFADDAYSQISATPKSVFDSGVSRRRCNRTVSSRPRTMVASKFQLTRKTEVEDRPQLPDLDSNVISLDH